MGSTKNKNQNLSFLFSRHSLKNQILKNPFMKKYYHCLIPKPPPKNETPPYPQNQKKRKVNILTNKHRIDQNAILLKNSIFFEKTKILYSLNSRLLNETTPLTQFDGKN